MNSFETQKALESTYVMPTYGRKQVEFVDGKGMHLTDSEGKTYLDFLAGIGTVSLGHCHPALVRALQTQAEKLIHVGNYFYVEGRGQVAEQLSGLLNKTISVDEARPWQSFFANSGAEANECAIKLARLWGKKTNNGNLIVTLNKSFHGRTLTTLSATAQPSKQESFKPLPGGFIHIPINDIESLAELFALRGDAICALMIECVQGESGVNVCSKEYLQAAASLLKKNNALLICDEVQCGMFRCGTYPFAFQHFDIVPDIVSTAKGIASGFPTGVCSAREEIACSFEPGDHGSTFGGSCLAIAAIGATLQEFQSSDVATSVTEVGAYLQSKLAELPHIKEVRGIGLMVACEFDGSVDAADLVNRALAAGFILNNTDANTVRFLPPLICRTSDVDDLIKGLQQLLI